MRFRINTHPLFKQGFFTLQTRLPCTQNKACLQSKEALFANGVKHGWKSGGGVSKRELSEVRLRRKLKEDNGQLHNSLKTKCRHARPK